MKNKPSDKKVINIANYLVSNKTTIRKTALAYNISKSSVHNYIHKYLPTLNCELYQQVIYILKTNFNEKHIRGGISTKNKFKH